MTEYKRPKGALLVLVLLVTVSQFGVQGAHFRGGTINWKPEGGLKVHFYFKMGWTYGSGPGCTPSLIGKLVTGLSGNYWTCQTNNCGTNNLHNVNYYCTAADKTENWEQGQNDFTYTFPNTGPFTISYQGGNWITLANGKGGSDWNVATTVDLRTRSDTAAPNASPESQSKPMYYVPINCEVRIKLPIIDPDNDRIRCRWSQGSECQSVCNALPYAQLDEETCTLVFNSTSANNYVANGVYAVALTIEDYPIIPMTIGGTQKTPSDVISTVPLQFLVQTKNMPGPCDAGPRFVPPTPKEGEVITVEEGDKVEVGLFADNGNDTSAKANKITASGPVALTQSPVVPDKNRTNTYTTTLSWKTGHTDIGSHIVCGSVTNTKGRSGQQRCFTITVVPKGCKSAPCQNNGKCIANMGNHTCICRPGFTGVNCQINIDDCVTNTCPFGTYCLDGVNSYTCPNITTTTTTTQMTTTEKNYTGMCPLLYDNCDCRLRQDDNERDWMGLTRKAKDVLCFFFGFPLGLVLSVAWFFYITIPCERNCGDRSRHKRRKLRQIRSH